MAAYRSALIPALPAGKEPDIEGEHSPDTVRAALGRLSYMRRAVADLETELESIPGARQRVSVPLSDPSAPAALAEAASSLERSVELSTRFPALVELTRRANNMDDVRAALEVISASWNSWVHAADLQLPAENRWMSVFKEWYPRWSAAGRDSLAAAVEWRRATAILRDNGLEEFQHQIEMGEVPDRDISLAFRRGVASTSAEERMRSFSGHISLSEQNSSDLARLQEAFATIQGEATQALPATLMARRSFRPGELHGKVGTLRRNLDRKRGARSFRSLLEEFTEEILEATPCFFASPASLATFVDPTAVVFDVVIFDEASQITVDQAMGAIGRAKAVIISGDSRQMPPTRFGKTGPFSGDDEDLDDPDRPLVETVVSDLESILSEAVESGLPRLWLSWHYRSRDESLIAFSNEAYYEGKLSSFPSPGSAGLFGGAGVSMRRVDGTFDRSRGATFRTNRVEAEEIVRDIHRRLNSPALAHQSIGVVTFNIQQRNLILDLLEDSRDPLIRAAMEQEKDPLFVKNLENVQGDERDVIIFSTAFSPREPGGPLPLNFGPLSREGGERRFNVAITRARSEVLVVTSFDPEDIDLNRTRSRGMQDLREYMLRARARTHNDGAAAAPADTDAEGSSAIPRALSINDNPVRDRLMHELRERGWEVEGDYGLSSYTLDIVVREPGSKVWLLAVMFDDEKWSSLPTVTDRDITPQLLTSMMGWLAVERVWLPELRRDAAGVIDRIDASARAARERYQEEERKAEKRQERAAKKLAGRKAKLTREAAADSDAAPCEDLSQHGELTPKPDLTRRDPVSANRAPVRTHQDPDVEPALTWREVPSMQRSTPTKAKRAAEPAQRGTQEDPQPTPQSAPQPKRSTIRVALKPATPENPTDTSEERWRFGEAWEKHGTQPGKSARQTSASVDDWGADIPPCPAPLTLPDTSPLGSREELEFPMSTARTAEVREAVREMIEESAPLPLQSLRVAIVKRFGRQRTSEKVNKILDTFIPQDQIFVDDSEGQEFVWPEDVYPENWHYYRPYPGRILSEIPLREIYNMARVLVEKYPGEYQWGQFPDEDFVRRILKEFSLLRLSPDSQARVSEALLLYGKRQ
ncbi:AAA domain-containing protein [Actinotignum sp. GS-2025f]|uniref:AAA domain-containing protein n=1 Tax=Actinotignum sp. GS-2025f TaxID=3427279 RepID=UPI003F46CF23